MRVMTGGRGKGRESGRAHLGTTLSKMKMWRDRLGLPDSRARRAEAAFSSMLRWSPLRAGIMTMTRGFGREVLSGFVGNKSAVN
jgi:hypothetical protein